MQISAPSPLSPFHRFAVLGDDLSRGGDGTSWPEQAARMLVRGDGEPALRNVAVAGATSIDVAIRQLPAAVELRPDLVSVICGVNDPLLVPPDPEVLVAVFDGIVDSLRRRLPHAAIVTATYPRLVERGVEATNAAIREVATRRGLICLEWAGHSGVDHPRSFAGDRLRPSPEGHRRMAAAFVEGVRTAAAGGRAAPC